MRLPQLLFRSAFSRRYFVALRETALGIAVALLGSIFLTLVAHFWICAGLHPETIFAVDWIAPLSGAFCGAWFLSQRSPQSSRGWRTGLRLALSLIVLWFVAWSYTVARFSFASWPRQVFGALGFSHLLSWSLALLFGIAGGIVGERTRCLKRRSSLLLALCVLALVPSSMQFSHWLQIDDQPDSERETLLSKDVTLRAFPPTWDGTTVRLVKFDLSRRPDLKFGIYDADSDDAQPFDDRNTTWLGQSLDRVLDSVQNRAGEENDVLCLVNGGFFGAEDGWTAKHEAPLVVDGKPLYNNRVLERDWPEQAGLFAVSIQNKRLQFSFLHDIRWENLRAYQTVLGGVRGLIVDGKAQNLKPGMGGTLLRCSRTSVGWTNDSRQFYLLSVRDPDGERASLNQRAAQKRGESTPSGGWDVQQVQQFWQKMKISNAVLFDGGESTQLAYRKGDGEDVFISSAYHLSRTFGYWRERPLRAYVPMLPPSPNHGGVLNYFYVAAPRREQR